MRNVNLANAKAHLSQLVERAAAGDTVRITRRGKPVAQITAIKRPRKRIDLASPSCADRHDADAAGVRPRARSTIAGPGPLLTLYLDTRCSLQRSRTRLRPGACRLGLASRSPAASRSATG